MTRSCLVILFLMITCWPLQAMANISKDNLIEDIQQKLTAALNKQLPSRAKSANESLIVKRVNRIVTALNNLPMVDVPDDVASWIQESILVAADPSWRLSENYGPAEQQLNAFVSQVSIGAEELSLRKAKASLLRKKELEKAAADYLSAFKNYWIDVVASEDTITILIPDYSSMSIGSFNFANVARSLPLVPPHKFDARYIDVRDQVLESRILSMTLALQFQKIFEKYAAMDSGTYGNLFSGAFDDGDPLSTSKFRNFDSVKTELDALRSQVVLKKENKVIIKSEELSEMLWISFLLRGQAKAPTLQKSRSSDLTEITFKNDKSAWEIIRK